MPNGFSFDFFGFSSLISAIARAIQAALAFLFQLLVAVYQFLLATVVVVAQFLLRMFGIVRRFFTHLWAGIIKRGLLGLLSLAQRFTRWLEGVLEPLANFLDKVLDWFDRIYTRIFGPILQAIQRVRRVLRIFKLFGFKWAQKLDARLLRLEAKIIAPYLKLRAAVVGIINVLDSVIDLGALIRRPILLGSVARVADAILAIFGVSLGTQLSAADTLAAKARRERTHPDKAKASIEARAKDGLSDRDKEEVRRARVALKTANAGAELPLPGPK